VAGGGRSSARETIGRVAAAAVARKMLRLYCGCEVSCPHKCFCTPLQQMMR
jgi:chorismate synthase